jgi:hypothetical protein
VDFQETDEYCNAHAHPVFLAGRDRMADLQIVHGRVSLPAKKNQMCTKQRFLLNAELGTEVWGGIFVIASNSSFVSVGMLVLR